MVKRGPVPEHPENKERRGNPGKRSTDSEPIEADPTEPDCPEWLDDDAKAEWLEVVGHLQYIGQLARVDGALIAQFCDAWSRWKQCVLWLRKNGIRYETQKERGGGVLYRLQPEVSEARQLTGVMLRLENEMGMTPAARHRMSTVPPGEEGDEYDRWVRERADGSNVDPALIPGTLSFKEAQEARMKAEEQNG